MPEIDWKPFPVSPELKEGDVTTAWRLAVDTISGFTYLRIRAEGTWSILPAIIADCGPDGFPALPLASEKLLSADCAAGALIGRLGGGAAGFATADQNTDEKPFPVGSFCIRKIPDKFCGPLFIGFNASFRPVNVKSLKVTVDGASPTL